MKNTIYIFSVFLFLIQPAMAKDVHILYIGNSYTYLPDLGTPEDPALPKTISAIAKSIDPELNISYESNTPGGYSFEKHFNDAKSLALMAKSYDKVILQGQSIESLELTPWWTANGVGVQSFSVYLPKVLDLVFLSNKDVTLYVNWGWSPKNSNLQEGHPGLVFPPASAKAGQKWCGKDKYEFQRMIDSSYAQNARNHSVKFAAVGDAWIVLQDAGLVTQDELYIPDDWSHASKLGSYIAALVLVRDSLGLDISKNIHVPEDIDPARAKRIQNLLAQ